MTADRKSIIIGHDKDNVEIDHRGIRRQGAALDWDDMRIVPGAFQFSGSDDPTLSTWQPGGAGATFRVYAFGNDDNAFFSCQLPHSYKEGSNLRPHIHWTPRDRGATEADKTVAWKLDLSVANIGGAFGESITYDLTDTVTGTDDQHEISGGVEMDGSGLLVSSMIMGRVYRDTTDTWAGTTAAQSPALLEVDIHFQMDSQGTSLEYPKT